MFSSFKIFQVILVYFSEGDQSRYVVASGGDDNALSVCVVTQTETEPQKPPTLQLLDATKMASAHSAQITGNTQQRRFYL